jgi:hypothetical protein
MSEPIFSDHPFAGWNAEITKSTDDVSTYGAIPVTVASVGCAGESCPSGTCNACQAGTVTVVTAYVPPF